MAYIYEHVDPETNKTFYVGKGNKYRLYDLKNRNNYHLNKLNKLFRKGYTIKDIAKITYNHLTDDDAYKLETKIIDQYGLENLCNIQHGGRGASFGVRRRDINELEFRRLLKKGFTRNDIAKKFNVISGLLKIYFFPDNTLSEYCMKHNIKYHNHNYKDISEDQFIVLLKQGLYITQLCEELQTNPNLLKRKFYPKETLKEYCLRHKINYAATNEGSNNNNYKHFDKTKFISLLKKGLNLKEIAPILKMSHGGLCRRYKKEFNVTKLKDLL